jgi:hypothetical protein
MHASAVPLLTTGAHFLRMAVAKCHSRTTRCSAVTALTLEFHHSIVSVRAVALPFGLLVSYQLLKLQTEPRNTEKPGELNVFSTTVVGKMEGGKRKEKNGTASFLYPGFNTVAKKRQVTAIQ